ncbi:MAG: PD-(D/E)XK nuclease family protein [Lentimicrobiaceae bacterium]|nr:PD-(D/E)XK nuclease family protein [Lentimicrobiaceae bacterium]
MKSFKKLNFSEKSHMKQAFLEILANHIQSHFPHSGSRLCVVLPNRRAGLFLKRYLVPLNEQPVWAPSILPIEDFTAQLSGLLIPDPLDLMTSIYSAHQQIEREHALSFDEFYGRASGLLHDFEEVEQYLVDPAQLFSFLSESKAISLWNAENEPLTPFEKNYLEFFHAMHLYYNIFRQELLTRKLATQGMATRMLAEGVISVDIQQWDHIIFAGFNALTPAQIRLIKSLTSRKIATMMWDADAWFMNNDLQEAGTFLRSYRKDKELGDFGSFSDKFKEEAHEILISGLPGLTGQANMAGHIIRQIMAEDETSRGSTAIVLADESLLLPLLNAMPEEAGAFNITMGYPLTQSPLYQLFNNIIQLHVNAVVNQDNQEFNYYFKDLLHVLRHPYAVYLISEEHRQALINQIVQSKRPYYGLKELKLRTFSAPSFNEETHLFAGNCKDARALLLLLQQCIGKIKSRFSTEGIKNRQADMEVLFNLSRIINRLQQFSASHAFISQLSTLQLLFSEAAHQMPVAFYGEPLQGIQIMGLLETRTLDFDNIILLSANEGVLPVAKSHLSYIPFDIRMHFGMPTHRDQQAIYAYHFYRLLIRSRKAWLIYNSEPGRLGGGERSRFITQLLIEMPQYSTRVSINETTPSLSARLNPIAKIVIEKDEFIMQQLRDLGRRGFSPTSLTSYLNCSLRFYFSYVLRLHETEQEDEHIDHRTLGIVVHAVMQNLLQPLRNQKITADQLKHGSNVITEKINSAFNNDFPQGDITTGRNLLIATLAKKWITLALEKEISMLDETAEVKVLALEKSLSRKLQTDTTKGTIEVKLTGKADRIDNRDNETLIIDYKTGMVSSGDLGIKAVEDLFNSEKPIKEKAFQLLFYIYLAKGDKDFSWNTDHINAALFSFRSIAAGLQTLQLKEDHNSALDSFEQHLTTLIAEIYDPGVNFSQTSNEKKCLYCPFKVICQR